MIRLLSIIMITLAGFSARSEYSVYGPKYLDVEAYEDGFVVLGKDGNLHLHDSDSRFLSLIKPESIANALYMCTVGDAIVIADKMSMSCLLDGRWIIMPVPEGMHISGMEAFYGGVAAVTEEGNILFWSSPFDKAQATSAEVKGRFIGMDSYSDRCYAVTDQAEIVTFDLGLRTHIFDFNSYYSEYYGDIDIVSIAAGKSSVCIAGTRNDGSPAAFISTTGNVWSERTFDYLEGESQKMMDKKAITAAYREYDDCYVILCEDGVIFHLPACSHCNYPIFSDSGQLTSIAFNGRSFMAVGEGIY